jgi:hypothetical protein
MESEMSNSEQATPQVDEDTLFAAVELEEKFPDQMFIMSALVPFTWLVDNQTKCRWPSHLSTNAISNFVVAGVNPKIHWSFCKVRKCIVISRK